MSKMLIVYHSPVRNKFENTLVRAVCCILRHYFFSFVISKQTDNPVYFKFDIVV